MKSIYQLTATLIDYAIAKQFILEEDRIYMANRLANFLDIAADQVLASTAQKNISIGDLLADISKWAHQNGKLEALSNPYDDLFETELMSFLVPLPSAVNRQFNDYYQQSPRAATDWYYDFSQATDYIKSKRIARNIIWQQDCDYGHITLAINLAKPEKDPKAIAAAALLPQNNYPKCLLCAENVGFAGHLNHPARQTHRTIDLKLAGEDWFLQYSPYSYYDEHIIVIKRAHQPMLINRTTYQRLADFVDFLPHYFIGSNAGLPIVGGSLLTHDHYQGGHYKMPIVDAKCLVDYGNTVFNDVELSWLNWPMTTLRLRSANKTALIEACSKVTEQWRAFSDPSYGLISYSDRPHHAITPIMRKISNVYEIDMVLRSNLTSEQYPDGVFHPHPEVHPVKKENIGLIEVMGYAVLPGRLKRTIEDLTSGLTKRLPFDELPDSCTAFNAIYNQLLSDCKSVDNAEQAVKTAIGNTFLLGLTHAAVIKNDAAGQAVMNNFIDQLQR